MMLLMLQMMVRHFERQPNDGLTLAVGYIG